MSFFFLFPVFSFFQFQFRENDWPGFYFHAQITATEWIDFPWVGWLGNFIYGGKEVSTRSRCGWGRKLLLFLVSPLKVGGHRGYTQKFGDPLKFIPCIRKKESLFERFWFVTNDKNMNFALGYVSEFCYSKCGTWTSSINII